VDLAVPRDFDPAINELEGVYLHDMDSLQAMAQRGMTAREQEMARCEEIIAAQVREFEEWLRDRATASLPRVAAGS
ncbi:MAG: hypothetical protein WEC72_01530, partial [Chthoniobacterales bacterium]